MGGRGWGGYTGEISKGRMAAVYVFRCVAQQILKKKFFFPGFFPEFSQPPPIRCELYTNYIVKCRLGPPPPPPLNRHTFISPPAYRQVNSVTTHYSVNLTSSCIHKHTTVSVLQFLTNVYTELAERQRIFITIKSYEVV